MSGSTQYATQMEILLKGPEVHHLTNFIISAKSSSTHPALQKWFVAEMGGSSQDLHVCYRVRLSKRRAKAGAQSTTNAVLVCKHRDMNEKELEAQVPASLQSLWLRRRGGRLVLSVSLSWSTGSS